MKFEDFGVNLVGDGVFVCFVLICGEMILLYDDGVENVVKVERLDSLDDFFCEDREGIRIVRFFVDLRGDFCDSNIFENF